MRLAENKAAIRWQPALLQRAFLSSREQTKQQFSKCALFISLSVLSFSFCGAENGPQGLAHARQAVCLTEPRPRRPKHVNLIGRGVGSLYMIEKLKIYAPNNLHIPFTQSSCVFMIFIKF
jgi:hypothetical protein